MSAPHFALASLICASAMLAAPEVHSSENPSLDRDLPALLFGLSAKEVTSRFSGAGAVYFEPTEGDPLTLMPLELDGHRLVLHINNGVVDGYETSDSRLQTNKGAHVGQTLDEVRGRHPDGLFHYGALEGSYMTFVVKRSGVSVAFQIDHADIPFEELSTDRLKVTDPGIAHRKVISVWVTRHVSN